MTLCSAFDHHYGSLTEWFSLCLTSAYIITLGIRIVPWFPFDPIGSYLACVSAFVIGWFRGFLPCARFILCMSETYFGLVRHSTSFDSFQILACGLHSCWTDVGCLMPSFQQIFSHRFQLISLGIRSRVFLSVPLGLQSLVADSSLSTVGFHYCLMIDRFFQVFDLISFIHTC